MRLSTLSSVDLPQPDGPMNAVTCPAIRFRFTSLERVRLSIIEIEIGDEDLVPVRTRRLGRIRALRPRLS